MKVHYLPPGKRPAAFDRAVAADVLAGKKVQVIQSKVVRV